MSTTAAVEVAATLGAASPSASRGPVDGSPESGAPFAKVLNELTSKALGESVDDRRDSTSRVTKRSRVSNVPNPSSAASSLEATSDAEVHGRASTLEATFHDDEKSTREQPSTLATSNDEPIGSRDAPSRSSAHADVFTDMPSGVEEANPATADTSDALPTALTGTITDSTSARLPLTERVAAEIKADDATSDVVKPPALSSTIASTGGNPAPSLGVISSVTPAPVALSSIPAASTAIRDGQPVVAPSTPSRDSGERGEQNNSASMDATALAARRTEGSGVATDRAFTNLVVGPNVAPLTRVTVSAAPNVPSSNTGESSLDVSDLASSISQATLGSDGSYTINVAMHPSDLGHVQAVVSLNGSDLHVAITPQTQTGHAALASAVESLKSELSRSGLNVNVSLRDPESRSGRGNEEASRAVPTNTDPSSAESDVPLASEPLGVSQIHLFL